MVVTLREESGKMVGELSRPGEFTTSNFVEFSRLEANALQTSADFTRAAYIFQHGSTPDDYLFAHTLASIAVARGDASATWIMTATLDRYLQSIGQSQIYGTQFKQVPNNGATQEPYNRTLVSDTLRRELGVPALAAQVVQQQDWAKQFQSAPSSGK